MKKLFFFSYIIYSASCFSLTVETNWNNRFERLIGVSCSEKEEYLCADLCQDYQKCEVKENYCGNCAGDNLFLRYFFSEIGQSIINQQNEMPKQEFTEILRLGNFVTLDAKSIFNFIDKFNSLEIRQRLSSLCPNKAESPLVFIEVHPYSREPEKVLAVACTDITRETNLFYLKKVYQLELN